MIIRKEDALEYHSSPVPGKVAVTSTKPCRTQRDLSLAYTPGVAVPCLEIDRDPTLFTSTRPRATLWQWSPTALPCSVWATSVRWRASRSWKARASCSNASRTSSFRYRTRSKDPKEIIRACQFLEPTFGGINLEDIKAPECFEIEEELQADMKIPVFHDDQHGTASFPEPALLNAIELAEKQIGQVHLLFNGAGASAISCAEHYIRLGVKRENIMMCDTKGVIYQGRTQGMNAFKARFARETSARTLADAFRGADIFVGLSCGNCVTAEMLRSMADNPIVLRAGQPRSGNCLRCRDPSASRRDRVHRPLRLSEPGK